MAARPMRSPVNAPGPVATASRSMRSRREAGLCERARELGGQAFAVRARRIARQQREHAIAVGHGHAAAARGRV